MLAPLPSPARDRPAIDAVDLLWTSRDVLRTPNQHALATWAALRATLTRRRHLHGSEQAFLDLCARVDAVDRVAFEAVWSEPRTYWWTLVAQQLADACAGGGTLGSAATRYCDAIAETDRGRALARHLDHFQTFALGIACRTGADWPLERPLAVGRTLAIPGTRWLLEAESPIRVLGFVDRRVSVALGDAAPVALPLVDGSAAGGVTLHASPIARHGACEVRLSPHAFDVPGLTMVEPALRAGVAFQAEHLPLVEQTLTTIAHHAPEIFVPFAAMIRVIALKPRRAGSYDDLSEPELPGSFIASAIPNRLELADHFIHELQHNRLSCVEELGPLFDAARGDAFGDARYYSPWREKLRALYGIFHGVYVYVALGRYWLRVYQDADLDARDRPYALDRVLRIPAQLGLATAVLRRHANLAPLGRAVLDQLEHDVAALRADVARAALPDDAPALSLTDDGGYAPERSEVDGSPLTVRASVRAHARRNDVH